MSHRAHNENNHTQELARKYVLPWSISPGLLVTLCKIGISWFLDAINPEQFDFQSSNTETSYLTICMIITCFENTAKSLV